MLTLVYYISLIILDAQELKYVGAGVDDLGNSREYGVAVIYSRADDGARDSVCHSLVND